ncbi:MAG: ACP S-malonyltransferase [Actinobacteria bacterium]|nr:ACP S-malonyltransferase [Actinomycetota bacterium]
MPVGVMFPGQGAQKQGMGSAWHGSAAWHVVERAEDVLKRPLTELLLEKPLDRTADAQLAVLLCSLMAWETARPTLPDLVGFGGHSLGQITALIASGTLSFEDGVWLASRRAEVTQAAADRHPGRMAALLGAGEEQMDAALAGTPDSCWLANDNAPGQLVIAGTPEGLEAATAAAREAGIRKIVPLDVGGAFHTPLMAEAREAFVADLASSTFHDVEVPVVSNGDARPYADGEGWKTRLADHLVQPVRWRQSLEALVSLGADGLVEVGPGNALSGMAKRTVPDVPATQAGQPEPESVEVG